jgi:hypothetical protein
MQRLKYFASGARWFLLAALALVSGGCRRESSTASTSSTNEPVPVRLVDVTQRAGIQFRHNNGAFGAMLMPESMGSGAAFFDYDGDDDADLFLVNGRDWAPREVAAIKNGSARQQIAEVNLKIPPQPQRRRTTGKLFRNNGDGSFSDATQGSGLDVEMLGMGASAGDYDNDGKTDLYVTAYGRNYLFHNRGSGRFKEVSALAGVQDAGWSTSAAWLDYDRDGRLDLFVCHYAQWTPANNRYEVAPGTKRATYSDTRPYKGELNRLYHNRGQGRFEDVSRAAKIHAPTAEHRFANIMRQYKVPGADTLREPRGNSLGVSISDVNGDEWPDIVIANDIEPNYLYLNNQNGTFREAGAKLGLAYNTQGQTRAGMGIDTADIDGSGTEAVLIGNFSEQMLGLYRKQGEGGFTDSAPASEVGRASLPFLTFGCLFVDVDNNRWPDIVTSNGHIDPGIKHLRPDFSWAQRPLLFVNKQGQFREVAVPAGLTKPVVGRGLAAADYDLDGNVDLLFTNNGGAPLLVRNQGGNKNHSLRLSLAGSRSNRSAIGARVEVTVAGKTLHYNVRSGSSYLSQSELALTVGLGTATQAESVVIRWPSRARAMTRLNNLAAGHCYVIEETRGLIRQTPLRKTHSTSESLSKKSP